MALGDRTAFWHDNWINLGRLCHELPVLYSFAIDPCCTIQSQRPDGIWNLQLHSPLSHTAQLQLHLLLQTLNNIGSPGTNIQDDRLLVTTGKRPTTKDFYNLFSDRGLVWAPGRWVWRKIIPHRHRIFLWLALKGRLNTKDNMVVKKWCSDAGCDQCPVVESVEHITLHCRQADWVWDKLGVMQAARANDLKTLVHYVPSDTWPICMAACLLHLWKAQNNRVFNNKHIARRPLLTNIADELTLWAFRKPKLKPKLMHWVNKLLDPG
uniref:Uncharacterized protein n=1 Tax=Avena sativa TaxID=4498 RepID=A0ACD5WF65_AVESA